MRTVLSGQLYEPFNASEAKQSITFFSKIYFLSFSRVCIAQEIHKVSFLWNPAFACRTCFERFYTVLCHPSAVCFTDSHPRLSGNCDFTRNVQFSSYIFTVAQLAIDSRIRKYLASIRFIFPSQGDGKTDSIVPA